VTLRWLATQEENEANQSLLVQIGLAGEAHTVSNSASAVDQLDPRSMLFQKHSQTSVGSVNQALLTHFDTCLQSAPKTRLCDDVWSTRCP
jgi:hypothetical protein